MWLEPDFGEVRWGLQKEVEQGECLALFFGHLRADHGLWGS